MRRPWPVRTSDDAAATTVWAAVSADTAEHAGGYFVDCAPAAPAAHVADLDIAAEGRFTRRADGGPAWVAVAAIALDLGPADR